MKKQKGFTLIEFVVALIVAGILLAALVFTIGGQNTNLYAEANQLASDIRYIQYLAITTDENARINFTSNQYSYTKDNGTTPIIHPGTAGSNTISVASGTSISLTNVPNGYIIFNKKGIPYINTTTALSSTAVITLSSGGGSYAVSITPETGRVFIS